MTTEKIRHVTAVFGMQWGDEGKGKIVDILSGTSDVVVRFQGGANAGHTVKFDGKKHILHLLPSGVLRSGKGTVLGNGMVIDPATLLKEIDELEKAGIDTEGRLFISSRAHVVMCYHRLFDQVREEKAGGGKIGTTLRGIGPCYEDKAVRSGIRMHELIDPELLKRRLEAVLPEKNNILCDVYGVASLDVEEVFSEYAGYGKKLKEAVTDTVGLLRSFMDEGKTILFEGAQGALLDLDLGTYPFVTSSNTCIGAIGTGCGFSPRRVDEVIGIVKAYCTRVGAGPFPTEAEGELEEKLRTDGGEYGATTGRPRRCGWLDLVALKHTLWANDVDALVITKLDVLDSLPEIEVGVAYKGGGSAVSETFPAFFGEGAWKNGAPEVEYETLPGWMSSIGHCRRFEELPRKCRSYLSWICRQTGCPLKMISVGPDREQTIIFDEPFFPEE